MRFGLGDVSEGVNGLLHSFEPVYNGGMEVVFVGEVPFKVATSCECLWAKRAAVSLRELTEKLVEVEVTKRRCDELAISAAEEGKVTVVHPVVRE
jgi:hypothetical protein